MKQKIGKNPSHPNSFKRKPKFSLDEDAFFESDPKRRRKIGGGGGDEVIVSDDSDEEGGDVSEADGGGGGVEEKQVDIETADEKRYRVAKEYLEKFRYLTKREDEDKEEGEENEDEREGRRDSLVAAILQKEQLEESGRAQRFFASRIQKPEALDEFQVLERHRLSVTAVALAEDDMRGFSASKDGSIVHWDVETGKKEKYLWPNEDVLVEYLLKRNIFQKIYCAEVLYLQSNPGGITIFGWTVDRALVNTLFFIEMSLILFVLGKTIIFTR